MDLVKLKIQEGPEFGQYNQDSQSIFVRLFRHSARRLSAVIDCEMVPGETSAATVIKVRTDTEVVKEVQGAIKNHNFVWARLRAIEINHGKISPLSSETEKIEDAGSASQEPDSAPAMSHKVSVTDEEIREAVRSIDNSIAAIVDSLPTNTALIVTSGEGDTRDVQQLQAQQKRFQKLYSSLELSSIPREDQFLDEEQQLLHKAVDKAKNGVCFFMVK